MITVLLVHPGGPFWKNKDEHAWSIPKGEYEPGEDPEQAEREFEEELAYPPPTGPGLIWGPSDNRAASRCGRGRYGGFAVDRRGGQQHVRTGVAAEVREMQSFPEVDQAEWVSCPKRQYVSFRPRSSFWSDCARRRRRPDGPQGTQFRAET